MTTLSDLQSAVIRINYKACIKIKITSLYGKWQATNETETQTFSPLCTKRELDLWLRGYEVAIDNETRP